MEANYNSFCVKVFKNNSKEILAYTLKNDGKNLNEKEFELLNQALELINNDKPINNLKQNFDKLRKKH